VPEGVPTGILTEGVHGIFCYKFTGRLPMNCVKSLN